MIALAATSAQSAASLPLNDILQAVAIVGGTALFAAFFFVVFRKTNRNISDMDDIQSGAKRWQSVRKTSLARKETALGTRSRDQQNIVFAVSCVALVGAIVFTVLHATHGWGVPYPWLTSVLVVVWIFAVLTLFRGFQLRTMKRKEARRRFYLSPEWVYNHEIGYAPLSRIVHDSPYDFVMFAGNALAKMSYGFEVAEAPDDFNPTMLISSQKFTFHFIEDAEDPADKGVVIDKWAGSLQKVQLAPDGSRTYIRLGDYANATTLVMLLDTNGAFNLQYGNSEDHDAFGLINPARKDDTSAIASTLSDQEDTKPRA